MPSSRGSSQPRDQTQVSYVFFTGRGILYHYCHLRRPEQARIKPNFDGHEEEGRRA